MTTFTTTFSGTSGFALPSASSGIVVTSFATSTPIASASVPEFTSTPTSVWGYYNFNDLSDLDKTFMVEFADLFNVSLGALQIGLVLAAMTFGVVVTKAISYFRRDTSDGALIKTIIATMLLINLIQIIANIQGTYTALVIDFGRVDDFISPAKSITLQFLFTTVTACIAQLFFACRLHAIMRNIYLTMFILFCMILQLAFCIYGATVLVDVGNRTILMFQEADNWPVVAMFAVSAALNIIIAAVAYVRMQKPYVLQKHGRTTFMSELEYWTVKSLFACGIFSLFDAIALGIMMANMIWIAGTSCLGNLYTLSVLLNVNSRILAIPVQRSRNGAVSIPQADLSDRASAATLTDDMAVWEDMVKSQAIKASLTSAPKDAGLPSYAVGYHVNDGAV